MSRSCRWGGATLDVVNIRARLSNDQSPLELSHVLGVDPEVRLQRHFDVDASGMYTNDPPDHTAEFSAASLLSLGGMIVAKY